MLKEFIEKNGGLGNCPAREMMDKLGDKWSLLIVLLLDEYGTMRFNQLNNLIGTISQKVLTGNLKDLEADGLITRVVFPEVPPRVEYTITPLGKSLVPVMNAFAQWSFQHIEAVKEARAAYKKR